MTRITILRCFQRVGQRVHLCLQTDLHDFHRIHYQDCLGDARTKASWEGKREWTSCPPRRVIASTHPRRYFRRRFSLFPDLQASLCTTRNSQTVLPSLVLYQRVRRQGPCTAQAVSRGAQSWHQSRQSREVWSKHENRSRSTT